MYVVLFLHHSVYYSEETQWHFCSRTVNGEVKKNVRCWTPTVCCFHAVCTAISQSHAETFITFCIADTTPITLVTVWH